MAAEADAHVGDDLLARSRQGDRAALEQLLVQELPRLRAFVRLNVDPLVRARESCSDLVQSVCRELLGNLGELEDRGPQAFRAWLFAWTLHKIRDRRKFHLAERRSPAREVPLAQAAGSSAGPEPCYASAFSPSRVAIAGETAQRLEAAFDRLPESYREILALSRIAGLSHAEIAERTNKSVGNVRVTLHRAVARLATVLEEMDEGLWEEHGRRTE
jgi:RNA polymerase sigma-70 factor (ECF subfamily)